MRSLSSRKAGLLATAAILASTGMPLAHAQDSTVANSGGAVESVETVTVTARRTKENLQSAPVSITALTADDIEQRGMTNILDIAQSTPSLTITPGGNYSGKSAQTFIRGVGQSEFTYAFQPGVGYYIDDVYYGTVYGSIFQLGNIDSVQVLRGPQGTLFGKNNEGGAILLSTPEPTDDYSGLVEAGYGSYNRFFVRGAISIPVTDDLGIRLFGASNKMDGYVTRIDFACANPALAGNLTPVKTSGSCKDGTEGGDDEQSLSAAIKWAPSSNFQMRVHADYHRDDSEAGAETLLYQHTALPFSSDDAYNTFVALPNYGLPIDNPNFVTKSPFKTYASYRDPGTGYAPKPVNKETFWSISDGIDWDVSSGLHIKNVAAYQQYKAEFVNTDPTPLPTYLEDNILPYKQFTEELDISGTAFDGKLEWLAGAYYFWSKGYYRGHIELPSTLIVPPFTLPFAPGGVYGLDFNLNDPTTSKSTSGFLHGIYHFTDKLSLELGARYSVDDITQVFNHTYTQAFPDNPLFPAGTSVYSPGAGGESKDNRIDPKASLQYQWTPEVMTYASYSTGYKAGGINPKPVLESDIVPFKEEKLTAYEAGIKTEWFQNKLLVNVSGYLSDYRNMQLSEFLPPPLGDGGTVVINAGHARIKGVEANFQAILFSGFSLDGSLGYLDYKNVNLGAAAGQVGGPTLGTVPPGTPTWTTSLGLQYDHEMGRLGSITGRLDWSYRSKEYWDLANTETGAQAGYSLVNARLAWSDEEAKWTAALEVNNLFDKLYYYSKGVALNSDASVSAITGTPGMPRTVFFSVTRKF